MTHGAFYEYFKDKSALYSEVLSCFLTDPLWWLCRRMFGAAARP